MLWILKSSVSQLHSQGPTSQNVWDVSHIKVPDSADQLLSVPITGAEKHWYNGIDEA